MSKLNDILGNPLSNDYYIIGETAYHHEADFEFMMQIIDDLIDIGVDAIKFHIMINVDNFATSDQFEYEDIKAWLFSESQWEEILDYVTEKEVDIVILPDEIEAMDFIINRHTKYSVSAMELHAASLNEYFMLNKLNEFEGVKMLGIGGSTFEEINYALGKIEEKRFDNLVLMYGIQNFPTDYTKIKLLNLKKLKGLYNFEIGYADHTSFDNKYNSLVTTIGYLMGARIIEKHYSPQPGEKRNDFEAAVSKNQLNELKELLALSKKVLGTGDLSLNREELDYGKMGIGKKALVANRDLKSGTHLATNMFSYKSSNTLTMIRQSFIEFISEYKAKVEIKKNQVVTYDMIEKIVRR